MNSNGNIKAGTEAVEVIELDRYAALHSTTPNGPGDSRPTAQQIIVDQGAWGSEKYWKGRTIVITGGSAGLGLESARALHQTGAQIIITGRDAAKTRRVAEQISKANPESPPVLWLKMDNDSLKSVQDGAETIRQHCEGPKSNGNGIHVLMLNAGVVAATKPKTQDGFEAVFGWNYLAPFLFAQLLLPELTKAATFDFRSRLVVVASAGHRASDIPGEYCMMGAEEDGKSYNPSVAYAQSKTACILMANEFERRYGHQGIHALSLNPGLIIATEIGRGMDGTVESRRANYCKGEPLIAHWEKSVEQGAATQVWACVARELEAKGGLYLDDVQVGKAAEDGPLRPFLPGWKSWIWSKENAAKLWQDSMVLVAPFLDPVEGS